MTAWLAPPCSGPQSALMPAAIDAKRFASLEPTRRTVRRGAVLLVVGVQDQQLLERVTTVLWLTS